MFGKDGRELLDRGGMVTEEVVMRPQRSDALVVDQTTGQEQVDVADAHAVVEVGASGAH